MASTAAARGGPEAAAALRLAAGAKSFPPSTGAAMDWTKLLHVRASWWWEDGCGGGDKE